MFNQFQETLTFDDVLLVPQKSEILPKDAILKTKLTNSIELNLPFLAAPMDTVCEHKMAIALALAGGMGVIHKNLSIEGQVEEVKKVKRYKNAFHENPTTVLPSDSIKKVHQMRTEFGYKKFPVVDESGKLLGLISDVDYLISYDSDALVKDRMKSLEQIAVAKEGIGLKEANEIIRERRTKTVCVVNNEGKLVSIVTRRDIEKSEEYPEAITNANKQLRVGAATGVGVKGIERAEALIKAGVDVLIVDTAHGHSIGVINTVKELKNKYPNSQIIAGNIASAEAAEELINVGVDAVKVGIGPGSICTTRVVAGIGVPQLSAVMEVVKGVRGRVPVIADGGIKLSGDIVKALAGGAQVVMMGNMFAGTDESPGRVEYIDGKMYKIYRGMGSLEAMELGSKDRYGQADTNDRQKFVPEGVSGRVLYKGPVNRIIYQLAGGLRSGMGYNGASTIEQLQKNAKFIKISSSSLKESHPHDLGLMDAAPNYEV
ncbi:MAG: IMP dehydrogenase [Candidatus Magasanikiibacteriota bacterium]